MTGLCTAGDTRLLPLLLETCERYRPMAPDAQQQLIALAAGQLQPLFA